MKKEEKTKRTRDKILQAAIFEFGTKSYEMASLNTICNEYKISKGLIYHNFKNKDELYIECVKMCYEAMIYHFQNKSCVAPDIQEKLKELLKARQLFFDENPYYRQIFFNSILMPPKHLLKELKLIQGEYNAYVSQRYKELIIQMKLRKDVSVEKALTYLMFFQEMYNNYFRDMYDEHADMKTLIESHETKLSELLDILFYGIADSKKQ